jgi:ketosteroid isomerase-like protein
MSAASLANKKTNHRIPTELEIRLKYDRSTEDILKTFLPVLLIVLFVGVLAAFNARPCAAFSEKPAAETLRRLEGEFMKAAAERGSAGYLSYYADDSVELPNGGDAIQGKVNIAKGIGFLDDKNNHLTWTPVSADISASGDLGYTYGTFEFTSMGKDGKPAVERGKYTSIWKKQKDGSWKVVLDMGNSSASPKS